MATSRTLETQIADQQTTLEEVLKNLDEDAQIVDWEEQLQLLSNRIQRLQYINLAAIDEYKLESSKDYLDQQNAELEDALNTLITPFRKLIVKRVADLKIPLSL